MADIPETLELIVTNPNLSGRAMKAMILVRADDGSFGVQDDYPAISLGDGQTTIVHVPLGGRVVFCEQSEPALPAVIANHPDVTGRPAMGPLSDTEETRRAALAGQKTRTPAEQAELDALQVRVTPAPAKV